MLFKAKLKDALSGENIIYVISQKEHINLLPDGAVKILVKTDIDTIKERFKNRMRGNLPAPVEQMLVRNHGIFDNEICDYRFDGVSGDIAAMCETIKNRIK